MKKPEMNAELTEITPALAVRWLELNNDNRNISDKWVDAIAADIAANKWDPNNATIGMVVDEKGRPVKVADGQHRLWAVERSKKAIWTWVVYGTEENLRRENIDRVKPRSVADQLQLLYGVKSARKVAAYCNVIMDIETVSVGHQLMTMEMCLATRQRHATGLDWAIAATAQASATNAHYVAPSGLGGTLAYCYPTAPAKVDHFLTQLRDGENITRTDPAYALRSYVDRTRTALGCNRGVIRVSRHELVVMTLRATLSAIKGEQLSALKPGAIMGGGFFKEACKYFARAQVMGPGYRKRTA